MFGATRKKNQKDEKETKKIRILRDTPKKTKKTVPQPYLCRTSAVSLPYLCRISGRVFFQIPVSDKLLFPLFSRKLPKNHGFLNQK
jgi:hypothetical protein